MFKDENIPSLSGWRVAGLPQRAFDKYFFQIENKTIFLACIFMFNNNNIHIFIHV